MVTEIQMRLLVDTIVKEFNPNRIVLFGSYAVNKQTKDSDVDLIVVIDTDLKKGERKNRVCSLNLLTATDELLFPKDLLIYSEKEFQKLKNNSDSFLHGALKQSRNLYVR
jgi:predicted nucleotidyltransferase